MDAARGKGRPKGSKDKPRPPGAPKRGHLKKICGATPPILPDVLDNGTSGSVRANALSLTDSFPEREDDDADDEYEFDDKHLKEMLWLADEMEQGYSHRENEGYTSQYSWCYNNNTLILTWWHPGQPAAASGVRPNEPRATDSAQDGSNTARQLQLRDAVNRSQTSMSSHLEWFPSVPDDLPAFTGPFFSSHNTFLFESDSDDGEESDNQEERGSDIASSKKGKDSVGKSWCCIPNVLPDSPLIQGGLNSQSTCQIGFISTSKTLSSQCSLQRMVGNSRNLRLTRIMAPTLLRLSGSIRLSLFSISPSTGSIQYPCTVPVFTFGFPTTSLTICAVQSVGVTSLRNKGLFPLGTFLISRMCSTLSHGHTTADMDAGLTSKGGARHSWSPSLNTFVFHSRPSFRIKVDSPIGLWPIFEWGISTRWGQGVFGHCYMRCIPFASTYFSCNTLSVSYRM